MNSAKCDANGFFKVLLLSSNLLISRHPFQKSKFGGCAVTGYYSFNRLLISQSNLQASETECHCKNVLITLCVRKVIAFCVERLLHFALKIVLQFKSVLLHFALVLHFTVIRITFCVNITFCGDYYCLDGRLRKVRRTFRKRKQSDCFFFRSCVLSRSFFTAFQLKAHCQPCVAFGVSENGFLILDLPDFAVERNVNSEIGFVTLVTFLKRVQYA